MKSLNIFFVHYVIIMLPLSSHLHLHNLHYNDHNPFSRKQRMKRNKKE